MKLPKAQLLLILLWLAPALAWAQTGESERAQAQLKQVREDIQRMTAELQASRQDYRTEQARLRETDLAIQTASTRIRELGTAMEIQRQKLSELEQQREVILLRMDERMDGLGQQVRASYVTGSQSRMRLLLNQDDPARVGRMLAYYEYLNQAQLERIDQLRAGLLELDAIQSSIDAELAQLSSVQTEQHEVLEALNGQREQRHQLLAQLDQEIGSGQARLDELERNRRDLEQLIERLSDVLSDIPNDLGRDQDFQRMKKRMPMPVKGPVRKAYGQKRSGGLNWQGWLIEAPAGAEVRSVAHGRVAFADWLRGYGLLLIIDHGQGYMSLFGHNESLLREVGDWVSAGDAVSIVGSNPGGEQGLFFELRKDGKAIDPAGWIDRRK